MLFVFVDGKNMFKVEVLAMVLNLKFSLITFMQF